MDKWIYTSRRVYTPFFSVSGGLTTRCHDSMKERLNSRISRPEIGVKASKVEAINSADLSHLLTAELG